MSSRFLSCRLAATLAVAVTSSFVARAQLQIPKYALTKILTYVQTGPSTVELQGGPALFVVYVDELATSYPNKITLEAGGASYPIPVQAYGPLWGFTVFDRSFATSTELERAFPTNTLATFRADWTTGVTTPGSRVGALTIPAPGPAPSAPITNFASLQNWEGGPLNITWRLPSPAVALRNLYLYRATSINFSVSETQLITAVAGNDTGATLNGIDARPGETIYGELSGGVLLTNGPATNGGAAPIFAGFHTVRFPIRRASLAAPVILTQPKSTTAVVGRDVELSISASGADLAYQWGKAGNAITGATNATITLRAVQLTDAGSYTVVVSNSGGSVTSDAAVVTVEPAAPTVVAPAIASGPGGQTATAGTRLTLAVTATGTPPLAYQWLRNGAPLAGATQSSLVLERARPSDSGQYAVAVTNSVGTVTSSAAELKVNPVSRISNLSILTSLSSASDTFTLGFVLQGGALSAGSAAGKPVLIRAVGPSLVPLGLTDALADPQLELFAGATASVNNDNWGGSEPLTRTFTATGAFAFVSAASRDAALVAAVTTVTNSVKISGTGSGTVLAELYDATPADDFELASPRFANVSVLKPIGAGLTAGFVVTGAEPVRLLVRAIGPGLAAFGVAGTVPDPRLDLFASGSTTAMAANDNWGTAANAPALAAAADSVGAFRLDAAGKDAALLVTLPPGSYTAQVTAVGNASGVALVEVYEVP